MRIPEFGQEYTRIAAAALIAPAEGTYAGQAGEEVIEMSRAYAKDGSAFLSSGDWVNAAAAYSYGLGWLTAGQKIGLVAGGTLAVPRLEEGETGQGDLLSEKTARYHHLLHLATGVLAIAPDSGSVYHKAAVEFLLTAQEALQAGRDLEERENQLDALARYSYAFGWLDAGVRAGLFRIRKHREIFTV
jgi:hypothetical protein